MPASVEVIRAAIAPVLERAGVDLEAIEVQSAGRRDIVRVVVDRDGGVDLDLIAELSREISAALDAPAVAEALAAAYVLEVTSPGVDRPLTEPRHWRRARGRLVEVRLVDGTVVVGRVGASDASGVGIDERVIPLAEVVSGHVQVEFSRPSDPDAERDLASRARPDEEG